ncbi:MAG: biotin-dependent carboxyltransferase family protein [Pseudomonadota bacterium]
MRGKEHPIAIVHAPGLATSVQDLGRRGGEVFGLSRGGAADMVSAALANRTLANPSDACVLECTLVGPELEFLSSTQIAFAGASVEASLNGAPLAALVPHMAARGARLRMGPINGGARVYLAVQGGWQGGLFFGSRATHLTAGAGGYAGRILAGGDHLYTEAFGAQSRPANSKMGPISFVRSLNQPVKILRVTAGPEWPVRADTATLAQLAGPFRATQDISRMGIRLNAQGEEMTIGSDPLTLPPIISGPVFPGTVQWPNKDAPILLGCDCQATGGYPRVMQVIESDLPLIGQVRPGDQIWFRVVSATKALAHRAKLKAQFPEIF